MTDQTLRPFTFETLAALVDVRLPGYARAALFYALPELWQREAWRTLAERSRRDWEEQR